MYWIKKKKKDKNKGAWLGAMTRNTCTEVCMSKIQMSVLSHCH